MVTSRRRQGAAGRATEWGRDPELRTVEPGRRRSGAGCQRKWLRFWGVVLRREGGGGREEASPSKRTAG